MKRAAQLCLLGLFLAIILAVPVSQAVIDVTVGEEDRPYFLTLFSRAPSEKNLREFEDNLERTSYYEQKIRPVFQLARYHALRDLGEKATRGAKHGWFYYTPGLRYLVEPLYSELLDPPEHDPVQVIADLARQLKSKGIALWVMPVPGKASVHPERLRAGVQPEPAIAAHTRRVMAALRKRGVQVVNLHDAFLAHRKRHPERVLYMRGDTHWTGFGARLAAQTVASRIKKTDWYRARPKAQRYLRREVTVSRRGDVPRMTQIPHQEQLFSAEDVRCYQVTFAKGEDRGETYEEPDEPTDAPVLVLGDSFSRVFEYDEPEAAGWVSNLAYELQTPVAAIVNDGGASTLVRQELARDLDALQGKKLVIWTFVERDIRFGMQGWQPITLWPGQN